MSVELRDAIRAINRSTITSVGALTLAGATMRVTGAFVKMLLEKELLMSKTLQLDLVGESGLNLSGIYAIDEEKLKGLNDESFLDLRQRGFLPVIYAHLTSLNQVYRLSQKKHANAS